MSEHEGSDESGSRAVPRGQYLPLNSKRLSTTHLRQIASALDLPTTGAADQLRQVIEGKLETEGHEAINIQVVLEDSKLIETKMCLLSEGGVIVTPQPLRRETTEARDDSEELGRALEEAQQRCSQLGDLLDAEREQNATLQEQLKSTTSTTGEVSKLREELRAEKEKVKQLWRTSCEQVRSHDELISVKDAEIEKLKRLLLRRESDKSSESAPSEPSDPGHDDLFMADLELPHAPPVRVQRRGKAPPINAFTGENPELTMDDWLPSLKRVERME